MTIGLIALVTITSLGLIGYGVYHHIKEKKDNLLKEFKNKKGKINKVDIEKLIEKIKMSFNYFPSIETISSFVSIILTLGVGWFIFSSVTDTAVSSLDATANTLTQLNYTLTHISEIVPGFSNMFGVMVIAAMAFFTLGFLRRTV